MDKKKCTAIILAAGQGKRMGTKVQKQFLNLGGKPVLWYALYAFENSPVINDIILVTGGGIRPVFGAKGGDRGEIRIL